MEKRFHMPWVEAPTAAIVGIRESLRFVSHEPRRDKQNPDGVVDARVKYVYGVE